jgi:hypothetical protein
VAGLIGLILLAGCSSDVAAQGATDAAVAFVRAEPARACGLLAPDTAKRVVKEGGCAEALAKLKAGTASEVQRVEVAGESAQVRLDGQVVFLARFPDGWRVTAAGCVRDDPDPAVPYECEVEP